MPDEGWTKANIDGAMVKLSKEGGGGVILRDHHDDLVAGACHLPTSVSDPEQENPLACRCAVKLTTELSISKFILKTNN